MVSELDVATGSLSRARLKLGEAEYAAKQNPYSDYYRTLLEDAKKAYNLACLDRANAREKVFIR